MALERTIVMGAAGRVSVSLDVDWFEMPRSAARRVQSLIQLVKELEEEFGPDSVLVGSIDPEAVVEEQPPVDFGPLGPLVVPEPAPVGLVCPECGADHFTSENGLGVHRSRVHQVRGKKRQPKPERTGPIECPSCGREFTTTNALGPHSRHCKGSVEVEGKVPDQGPIPLEKVAEIARRAPKRTKQWEHVARELNVTQARARQLLIDCRKQGLLPRVIDSLGPIEKRPFDPDAVRAAQAEASY